MSTDSNGKPKSIDYFRVPHPLWRQVQKQIPQVNQAGKSGRKRVDNRIVLNGIWYVLWTGCQWKAVQRDWLGVSSTTLHDRFQEWQRNGVLRLLCKKW
jgi:putative transposase